MTPPESMPLDEALYHRPTFLGVWWNTLRGITSTWKELLKAQALIKRLEAGELANGLIATKAVKKLEQAIIKAGESSKSAKTLRHELLALIDKEFHQELTRRDVE